MVSTNRKLVQNERLNDQHRQSAKTIEKHNPNKILEVKNITKSYALGSRKIPVLKGIDFSMEVGNFSSIQGVSGVGKSTFLNVIGAFDLPDSGEIFLDGENRNDWQKKKMLHIYRRKKNWIYFSTSLSDSRFHRT